MKENNSKKQLFSTIRSKIILVEIGILGFLIAFISIIYYQNSKTSEVVSKVKPIRIPTLTVTNQIVDGINKTTLKQQYYLVTNDTTFKKQRLLIWLDQIEPAIEELNSLKSKLNDSLRLEIDTAIRLVRDFKIAQNEIDNFLEKRIDRLNTDYKLDLFDFTDDIDLKFLKELEVKNKFNQNTINILRIKSLNSLDRLEKIFVKLTQSQENLLKSDVEDVQSRVRITNISTTSFALLVGIGSMLFAFYFIRKLKSATDTPINLLQKLSVGKIPPQAKASKDELGKVTEMSNQLSENLSEASKFAKSIGEGNFEFEYKPRSEQDILGNSLIEMRQQLQAAATKDRKRAWVTEGYAKFSEILRSSNSDFKTLGDSLVVELVEYLNVNQGGIFVVSEENDSKFLDLIAAYAYNRKKYLQKKIKINEDYAETLVGQCYLERKKIYMTDVPQDYVNITSGLGEANANSLLIVPLMVGKEIEGVLELASFEEFDSFQIELIEQVAEGIASTISTTRNNQQTQRLVLELQEQTEAMRAQEEEMRQNMEELATTQEQMQKADLERQSLLEDVKRLANIVENHPDFIAYASLEGEIMYINPAGLEMLGLSINDDISKLDIKSIHRPEDAKNLIDKGLSKALKIGVWQTETCLIRPDGSELPVEEIISINYDKEGQAINFSITIRDINQRKEQKAQIESYQRTLLDIIDKIPGKIFLKDKSGKIVLANNEVAKVYDRSVESLIGTTDFDFFEPNLAQSYRDLELEIMELGEKTYVQEEELTGEVRYLQTTKMPFYINYLKETGLLGIQIDVTENVVLENKVRTVSKENKKLERQVRKLKDKP